MNFGPQLLGYRDHMNTRECFEIRYNFHQILDVIVVTYATLSAVTSDQGPRNSSWQGVNCTPVVSRSFSVPCMRQYDLARFQPSFEGEGSRGGQRPSTNLTSGHEARQLFSVFALPRELAFIRPQSFIQKSLDFHPVCITRNCKNQNDAPDLRASVPAPGLDDKDMQRTYVIYSTPSILSRKKPC
ncbi:hypothetical protein TNCV_2932431 [Trichonephila clavipes]|nr:hypothetical protein TNCV_2932431 [Trichonephila clavipes]